MFLVSRSVEFSAAHRLFREDLSDAENLALFGPCSNPYGHGHNYVLEVTVAGPLDPATGMVVHFQDLKRILHEIVVAPLDHRHLNHDVPFLSGILPTSENLVAALWPRLDQAIRGEAARGRSWKLHRLKLSSTARNHVEYLGPQ